MIISGKLGHGDTNRVYKPKIIDALSGVQIRKVTGGGQFSLALTVVGQVINGRAFSLVTYKNRNTDFNIDFFHC